MISIWPSPHAAQKWQIAGHPLAPISFLRHSSCVRHLGAVIASKRGSLRTGREADFAQVSMILRAELGGYVPKLSDATGRAGSAAALKRWMDDHGYKYPAGMDAVCEEYVKLGWCFVAEKAKVGGKANVDPKPRMKGVDAKLPAGSAFDGHVQAMAFRFKTDKLILPMRLSAYNEGEMHNIVYLLTDGPRKIRSIPEEYVVRQLTGADLFRNVTQPLPLRIIGGTEADIQDWQRQSLPQQRDPTPHNGFAKELFAGDLLAVKTSRLSHQFEEDEKMLLRIGEHFGLRGPEIDKLNLAALDKERDKAVKDALGDLKRMTM